MIMVGMRCCASASARGAGEPFAADSALVDKWRPTFLIELAFLQKSATVRGFI
jgi:hypothetical protein